MSRTYRIKNLYPTIESLIKHHPRYSFYNPEAYYNVWLSKQGKDPLKLHNDFIKKSFDRLHRDRHQFVMWRGIITQDCKNRREIEKLRGIRSHEKQELNKVLKNPDYEPDFSRIIKIKRQSSWWY